MTGLSLFRTSSSKVWSVTTLVAPTPSHPLTRFLSYVISVFPAGQPALGVQRRGAAGAGRGDRLPVGVVDHVAAGEDALDGGPRGRLVDQQITLGVGGELPGEQVRSRVVPDGHEHAGHRQPLLGAVLGAQDPQAR